MPIVLLSSKDATALSIIAQRPPQSDQSLVDSLSGDAKSIGEVLVGRTLTNRNATSQKRSIFAKAATFLNDWGGNGPARASSTEEAARRRPAAARAAVQKAAPKKLAAKKPAARKAAPAKKAPAKKAAPKKMAAKR